MKLARCSWIVVTRFAPFAAPHRTNYTSALRHLGAFGLLLLSILDSSPIPTFGGPDIVIAILAARPGEPWYYYSAVATTGSVIGAYLTFRVARRTGSVYLHEKFGEHRVAGVLKYFERWGTATLVASTLVPLPFPTSAFFAAAGALNYPLRTYIVVVTLARAARYTGVALIASLYGRHFIRVLRHPIRYFGWLLLIAGVVAILIAAAMLIRAQLEAAGEQVSAARGGRH